MVLQHVSETFSIDWQIRRNNEFSLLVQNSSESINQRYISSRSLYPLRGYLTRIVHTRRRPRDGETTDFFRTSGAMFQEKTSFSSQGGQRGLSLPRYIRRYLKIELTFINIISRGQLSMCISREEHRHRGFNVVAD